MNTRPECTRPKKLKAKTARSKAGSLKSSNDGREKNQLETSVNFIRSFSKPRSNQSSKNEPPVWDFSITLAQKRRDSLLRNILRTESRVAKPSPERKDSISILDSNVRQPVMHNVRKAKFHRMFAPNANPNETVSTATLYPASSSRPSLQKTAVIGKNAWVLNEDINKSTTPGVHSLAAKNLLKMQLREQLALVAEQRKKVNKT